MRTSLCLLLLVAPAAGQLRFSDATREAGLDDARLACAGPMAPFCGMGGGAAALDFDRDSWPDLFVLGGGRERDRLYRNRGDGTFEEVGIAAGVGRLHAGFGVAVGDVDADGYEDLFITSAGEPWAPGPGRHLLYRNRGDGTFEECAAARGVSTASPSLADGTGATFGDVDLDGDLDLVVAGWRILPFPGTGNRLFLNDGSGHFIDGTRALPVPRSTRAFSPTVCDMDGDGLPEILFAADFGTSCYFVGHGGLAFEERAAVAGLGLEENGMGSALGDLDNDGLLDWYVTSVDDEDDVLPFVATGNKLYWNEGQHRYREGAAAAGVEAGGWGWGALAVDLDHDGWLDLAEVNGWPVPDTLADDPARLWRNLGGRRFEEVALEVGFVHRLEGRGLLDLDFDRDGDRDLVVTTANGNLHLYRNELQGSSWLALSIDTSARPDLAPLGLGARIEARMGERVLVRAVDGGCHYLTRSEPTCHFGLGAAGQVDELRVIWPDGSSKVLQSVGANQHLIITP